MYLLIIVVHSSVPVHCLLSPIASCSESYGYLYSGAIDSLQRCYGKSIIIAISFTCGPKTLNINFY